jgi:hypothetical protein
MNHLVHRQCSSIVEKESKWQNGQLRVKGSEGGTPSSTKSRQRLRRSNQLPVRLLSVPIFSALARDNRRVFNHYCDDMEEVIHGELLFQYGQFGRLADGGRFERTQNPFCHFSDTTKIKSAADDPIIGYRFYF